jgi:hypothetical protein
MAQMRKPFVPGLAFVRGWSLDGIGILELSNFAQQLTAEAESTLFDSADIELHDVTKIIRPTALSVVI